MFGFGRKGTKGSAGRKPALRIFFATDVHGSDRCFRKFLAAANVYEADVLLLGGDVAGKGLVPVQGNNGTLQATVRGEAVTVPSGEEERLRAEVNRMGFYAVRMQEDDIDRMRDDKQYVEHRFREEIVAQLQGWCDLAAERLAPEVRCIITPGNDDPFEVDEVLAAASRIECPERELCDLGPVLLASLGDVTPTPWNTEREYEEDELYRRIVEMLDAVPADRRTVVNFHCPPYGSGLDIAAELDETLKPVIRGARPSMIPVGSKAVRAAVKEYQPVVGLHGHIHESRAAQRIGSSLCLNPGSDYSSDVLHGAVVDLDQEGRFVDFIFTTG
jgi:uncharacterized protein